MLAALHCPFDKPHRWINSGGLGTMGFGLPAALGVKLADPKATVVCITGDSSIQMNIQELSTAKQYDIPIVVVCLNNHFLGMMKQWQNFIYSGRHSQTYMNSLPDFVKLAETYDHVGIQIAKPEELKRLADIFRAQIVDVTTKSYIIQLTGTKDKLDAFVNTLKKEAVLIEIVRSGFVSLPRGEKGYL